MKEFLSMAFLSILLHCAVYAGSSASLLPPALIGGIPSATWFPPAAIATCLLRGRFSVGPLWSRTAICWPIACAVTAILFCLPAWLPVGGGFGVVLLLVGGWLVLLADSLPFLLGFLLLLSLNRWHRTRFRQALNLSEAAAAAPAVSGAARDLERPGGAPP
jgi:hypothetical protein